MSLTLTEGANTVFVSDGSVLDLNAADGVITYSGPVGLFSINVTTALSKPGLGGPAVAHTDLNSINSSNQNATLVITMIDVFQLVTQPGLHMVESAIGGTTQGTLTAHQIIDTSFVLREPPTPYQLADLTAPFELDLSHGPFSGAPPTPGGPGLAAFADLKMGSIFLPGTPFLLAEQVEIVHPASIPGVATSFDFSSRVFVPEPASVLFWLGVFGIGMVAHWWRRRK